MATTKPVSLYFHEHLTRAEGVSFGYASLVKNVIQVITHDPHSRLALQVCPLEGYVRVPDRKNVLFSMWESVDIPEDDIPRLRQVDVLIVPSKFCAEVLGAHADCPIHVVPLGVDTETFKYQRRRPPTGGDPWVWFWAASPDPRKGWGIVAKMWEKFFGSRKDVLLWMKTSAAGKNEIQRVGDNIVWDCRTLERKKFVELFYAAHGFLYPSMGEGFGLFAAEALATGLPTVGTSCTGHADFFHAHTGYPVPFERMRMQAITSRRSIAADGKYEVCVPLGGEMMMTMERVMRHYDKATKKAKRGADLIHTFYTWNRFHSELARVLRRYI